MLIKNEATTATQKVVNSIEGKFTPAIVAPSKKNGKSWKSDTIVVRAYKAKTFTSQANSPTVKRFKGKKRIFKRGTSIKLIAIKAKAPISKLLIPPV